jgi:hypothetical protein
MFSAQPKVLATAKPTRRPVKEPGPKLTFISLIASKLTFSFFKVLSIKTRRFSACGFSVLNSHRLLSRPMMVFLLSEVSINKIIVSRLSIPGYHPLSALKISKMNIDSGSRQ